MRSLSAIIVSAIIASAIVDIVSAIVDIVSAIVDIASAIVQALTDRFLKACPLDRQYERFTRPIDNRTRPPQM